jgi:hypothetical protein
VGCLITDFGTADRGKFKLGGQVGETDYSTAHTGSDPNYLGEASVVRCEFGHVGDGLRAAGGLKYHAGFLVHLVITRTAKIVVLCRRVEINGVNSSRRMRAYHATSGNKCQATLFRT